MAWTAAILTSPAADYPAIRALLGVSSSEVSDATIEQPPFLPEAEALVKAGITNYAALTGDNLQLLKAGVQAMVAALLCAKLQVERADSFRIGDYEEGGSAVKWQERAAGLLQDAQRALAGISTRTWTRPLALAVAGPSRSGSRIPTDLEQWYERILPRLIDWIEEGGEDDEWHDTP